MTCQRCNGTGWLFYEDDPSPAGVSLSPGMMTFIDPCPDCMEKGICPKCGGVLGEADDDGNCKCTACDYDSKVAEAAGPIYDEIDDPYDGEDMPDWEPAVSPEEVEADVRRILGK